MEAKHTPGPWDRILCGAGDIRIDIETPDNTRIAIITSSLEMNPDENIANARLISAAPELLEVCERLIADACGNCVECFPPTCPNACENLINAKNVIAKAKGEA